VFQPHDVRQRHGVGEAERVTGQPRRLLELLRHPADEGVVAAQGGAHARCVHALLQQRAQVLARERIRSPGEVRRNLLRPARQDLVAKRHRHAAHADRLVQARIRQHRPQPHARATADRPAAAAPGATSSMYCR
jgi:hypothetical protein